ncbi:S9 family peptidase [Mesorhizobium sp.]|uniref:S9 family peptidase n=1 Tax=Mesorhizobium sp. TaxID=1871066 RepID=UPI000FE7C3C4|nr:S9 family peptidase [Mesorhizobium sp.]RWM77637.1 MAG: S9 family peptidase [Mesorhizobium sp.]TIL72195.1 MAG: S9 family peptidase [Mesorhizobium sp.]
MTLPGAIAWLGRLRHISGPFFTHDGSAVLATVSPSDIDRGKSLGSHVWKIGLDGSMTQLTRGPNSDRLAKASPIDERIAFTSDRRLRGKMELFMFEGVGDARPLGEVPGTVEDFKWAKDGGFIVVLAADRGLNGGAINGATRLWWGEDEDPEVTVPGPARRRLFRIDTVTGETVEVGPRDLTVWEFDLAPSGAVAICSVDASDRGWHHPKMMRIDFALRTHELVHESDWQLQGLAVSPDGSKVAVLEGWSSDRGLVAGEMRVIDIANRNVSILGADKLSNATQLQWRDNESLWFTGWKDLGSTYGLIRLDGTIAWQVGEEATVGENAFVATMAVSPSGTIVAVRESIGDPQELFYKPSREAEWKQIGDVNGEVARGFPNYPELRHITWTGNDGLPLESFVFVPKDLGPGPHPMVVVIHGGPCYSAKHSFNPCGGLAWASAGYVVFVPNFRGSVGWGQPFAKMNIGDPAGAEFDDIMAGVDRCIALGLADPERLGVTGGSYGGFLSCWAVATTDRFKAAIPVSSICDQLSSHYSCEHDFHEFINGGSLELPEYRAVAIDRSPLSRLDKPTTPTLLIQGREDRCTPLGQAQEFYAALRTKGATAELVVYPREGHSLKETGHRHDAWERKLAWFDRYLRQIDE